MTEETLQLEDRLRSVSTELCDALRRSIRSVLGAATGPSGAELRPVQLTSRLGLDKSLASRVVRSLGEKDPLRALHGIPTPQGLALIARAAREAGADSASLESLEVATNAFADVLSEFSGGRTDLEATLAGWIPEHRARAERDARRSVFRGMTTLSGVRSSAVYNSIYLYPDADPTKLESTIVAVRQDVRRLRAGARLLVASLASDPASDDWRGQRVGLDGSELRADGGSLVLEELCSHPIPDLELESSGSELALCIGRDSLDVNEFATLGFGWRTPCHSVRHVQPDRSFGRMTFRAAWPTEALVVDLFLHRDIHVGAPIASMEVGPGFHASAPRGAHPGQPPAPDHWRRQTAPPVLDLSEHPSRLSSAKVRKCAAISENACREAGLDASAFTPYRVVMEFPVINEELTLWWPLQGA